MVTVIDKNTALVLIDLQNGIVNSPVVHPIKNILANAIKLVEAFHKANLPVVLVNVKSVNAAWQKTRKEISRPASSTPPSDDWFEIVSEIKTQPNDIFITKHTWGAFFETALNEELKKRNITGIVIGGVATSIGVEATARQASERAYNIAFAKDAMTDLNMDAHENSLKYIFPRIGEIDTTENIIRLLS